MKIILPGGSGQIGRILADAFTGRGHEVVILSRGGGSCPAGCRVAAWDGETAGAWRGELEGADVLINLAGRSVDCRYHARNRREIMESRVNSTRALAEVLAGARKPPPLWLQSSTATIYAHRFNAANDEFTGILGGGEPGAPEKWDFSIEVARAWEEEADRVPLPRTRVVKMRSAMVMSPRRDGVFDVLLGLVRKGLGGRAGSGRQYVSWIHEVDFIRAVDWLIQHEELEGPVNLASPGPLSNAAFMRALRKAAGVPCGLPAARWMLEAGAVFLRTETELILKSRRVVPARLLGSGFTFQFPSWRQAAADLCQRWRKMRPL